MDEPDKLHALAKEDDTSQVDYAKLHGLPREQIRCMSRWLLGCVESFQMEVVWQTDDIAEV